MKGGGEGFGVESKGKSDRESPIRLSWKLSVSLCDRVAAVNDWGRERERKPKLAFSQRSPKR